MGKAQLEKVEATNRQIRSNTKCNSKQTVEKSNEHPEWLPDGWLVDFRTRKSGPNMGSGYKCYIDPNGYKCYSKPEVLRYLETIKGNSCTSRMEERCKTMDSPSNDVVEKSTVEDLPPGWIIEAKNRKGTNNNRKDLFYIDPVNGYVFRSKKDALRYIESGDISTCAIKPTKRLIQDEDKLTPSYAGKKQKMKHSATKRRLFEGKEISDESSLELPDANYLKKGQDMTVSSGVMVAPVPTNEPAVKIQSLENAAAHLPEMKKTSDPDDLQEQNHVVDVMESASEKNHNRAFSKNKKFNVAPRFSRRLAGGEADQLTNVTNEQTLKVPERNLRKGRANLDTDLEKKSFRQLNCVPETEHSHKKQGKVLLNKSSMLSEGHAGFRDQLHQVEMDKIDDNKLEHQYSSPRDSGLPNLKVAKTISAELPSLDNPHSGRGMNGTRKSGLQKTHLNSNKSSNKEHQIPSRASKRLAGVDPELTSNSISNERAPEYNSKKSKGEFHANLQQNEGWPAMELVDHASVDGESSDKSRKPHKIPSLTNDQPKKLDEVNDEKSECQQSFAFHYSFSDPCLEFAIKTLTGALPVEDSVANGPTRIPESGPKNKLFENVTGSSSDKNPLINSKKSKTKKELKMPRRLSSRLAGHEPEVQPPEKAVEYATRKSFKDKQTDTAILTNGPSELLHAGEESKLIVHASDKSKTSCGESSNKSELNDAQTIPNEQLQSLEAENIDVRSEPQFPLLFGDSWSDPCLEFAIKTLTGALPVNNAAAAADILPVMTPNINDPPNKELLESLEQKSINEEAHDDSNQPQTKEELYTVCQPSKQLPDQPELRTCSAACENDPKLATRESYSDEGNITRNLGGRESLQMEAGNIMDIDINAMLLEEPSEEKQVLERKSAGEQIDINAMILEKPLKENQVVEGESAGWKIDINTMILEEPLKEKQVLEGSSAGVQIDINEMILEEPLKEKQFVEGESAGVQIDINEMIFEEQFDEKQVLQGESVGEQPQPETETINHDTSEREFCVSFMDSWSDPCLDFAFKTLTGTMPVAENLGIQDCFQEPTNRHDQRDCGPMWPEFGSSSIVQSNIPFHSDTGEKFKPGPQSSMSSSFLPQEKPSLHGFTGLDPQKHYSQCNNNFQRK